MRPYTLTVYAWVVDDSKMMIATETNTNNSRYND
jgi:hypothetical protein